MWLIDVLIILIGYIQCIESDIQNVLKWEYMTVCITIYCDGFPYFNKYFYRVFIHTFFNT